MNIWKTFPALAAEGNPLPEVTPTAPVDPSVVTPGVLGFTVFALLVLATWLLLRSFTTRLGKIRVPDDADATLEAGEERREPRS